MDFLGERYFPMDFLGEEQDFPVNFLGEEHFPIDFLKE